MIGQTTPTPISFGQGEIAALAAALMWTFSSMLWGRAKLSALGLNFVKNALSSVMLLVVLFVASYWWDRPLFSSGINACSLLTLSGFVGIVVGDTFYFRSLQILGPRMSLIMAATSPIFAAILGWAMLNENLGLVSFLGIVVAVTGIVVVVSDRKSKNEAPGLFPGRFSTGILFGILASICQALGGVWARTAMQMEGNSASADSTNPLESAFIRLSASAIIIAGYLICKNDLSKVVANAAKRENRTIILVATALGSALGIWLSQIAVQNSPVAIAQTLQSTCPIFAIPMVWFFYKQKVTWWSLLGTIIALCGIYLIFPTVE